MEDVQNMHIYAMWHVQTLHFLPYLDPYQYRALKSLKTVSDWILDKQFSCKHQGAKAMTMAMATKMSPEKIYLFHLTVLLLDYFNSLNFYKNCKLSRNQIVRSGVQVNVHVVVSQRMAKKCTKM